MFEKPFTKENLDQYLKELAKEFRKLNGKTIPADIVLIGGASVVERIRKSDKIVNLLLEFSCFTPAQTSRGFYCAEGATFCSVHYIKFYCKVNLEMI